MESETDLNIHFGLPKGACSIEYQRLSSTLVSNV